MHTAWLIFKNTSVQFLLFFGSIALSGLVLTQLSKWLSNTWRQFILPNLGTYAFGSIGVPFHEFCHAFFCRMFLHRISQVKWFDPQARGGAHGSVTHTYHPWNLYHRVGHFFIGLGPVILGPLFLAGLFYWWVPTSRAWFTLALSGEWRGLGEILYGFLRVLTSPVTLKSYGLYAFLYISACVLSQMELSKEDLQQARKGVLPVLLVLLVLNGMAVAFTPMSPLKWNLHDHAYRWALSFCGVWLSLFLFISVLAIVNLIVFTLSLSGINLLFGKEPIKPFQN